MNFKLFFQRAMQKKGHVHSKLHSVLWLEGTSFSLSNYLPLVEELCCIFSTEDRNFLSLDTGTSSCVRAVTSGLTFLNRAGWRECQMMGTFLPWPL